jgi:hypothetical protein
VVVIVREAPGAVAGLPGPDAVLAPLAGSRATLVEALAAASADTPGNLAARVGPAAAAPILVDELAAWLFRDLQARDAVGRAMRGWTDTTEADTAGGDTSEAAAGVADTAVEDQAATSAGAA